jgi:catechol 2,3-dioxygenase-like lactoylglutathione lyase family enzyme
MPLIKPTHYSIRTTDLDTSIRFYTEVLQLRVGFRPPFNFPGAWLYPDQDESEFGAVHLIGVDLASHEALIDYFGERRVRDDIQGSGSVDHLAFLATDWPGTRQRCDAFGVPYREQLVPTLHLFQVFLVDPSGVTIELNYRGHDTDFLKREST